MRLHLWTRRWGIHQRLITTVLAFTLIPALSLTLFSYLLATDSIRRGAEAFTTEVVHQAEVNLTERVTKIDNLAFRVSIAPAVQTALDAPPHDRIGLEGGRLRHEAQMAITREMVLPGEIQSAFIQDISGWKVELAALSTYPAERLRTSFAAAPSSGQAVWLSGTSEVPDILVVKAVNSVETQGRIGTLVLVVRQAFIRDLVGQTEQSLGGEILVVDGSGRIVSSEDDDQIGNRVTGLEQILEAEEARFETIKLDGKVVHAAAGQPTDNGWRVLALLPAHEYQKEVRELRTVLLVVAIAVLGLAVAAASAVATRFTKPIETLVGDIQEFGAGRLTKQTSVHRDDEIGDLAEAFNTMADNISHLVSRVEQEQEHKRELQVRSLRMQINPHFLYNTLDAINWSARKSGAVQSAEMAKSLSALFRSAIDADDLVTVNDELGRLDHYMLIQKRRYGELITYSVEANPDVHAYYLPTLILQPLVENAILHGVGPTLDGGNVSVTVRREDDTLTIEVVDDGVGMDEAELADLRAAASGADNAIRAPEQPDSIGFTNVYQRLHALFSEDASLAVDSELSGGTRVTITMPLVTEPSEYVTTNGSQRGSQDSRLNSHYSHIDLEELQDVPTESERLTNQEVPLEGEEESNGC